MPIQDQNIVEPLSGDNVQRVSDTHPVWLRLLGRPAAYGQDGTPRPLSGPRLAALAALAAEPGPTSRTELAAAIGISRQSLPALLTRLSADLGIDRQIHLRAGSGQIELDRSIVGCDLDDVEAVIAEPTPRRRALARLLAAGALDPLVPLQISTSNELARNTEQRRAQVRLGLGRAVAWFDLAPERVGQPLAAATEARPGLDCGEAILAHLDQLIRTGSLEHARRYIKRIDVADEHILVAGTRSPLQQHANGLLAAEAAAPQAIGPEIVEHPALSVSPQLLRNARVALVGDSAIDRRRAGGVASLLRGHHRGVLGAWAGADRSAVGALCEAVAPAVSELLRRPTGFVPPTFLQSLAAVQAGAPLEPASNHRHLLHDVGTILEEWSPNHRVILVLAREAVADPDMDRTIGALLDVSDRLSVLVVHRSPLEDIPAALAPFDPLIAAGAARPPLRRRNPRQPAGLEDDAALARAAAVVEMSSTSQGQVCLALAEHLLAATDAPYSVDQMQRLGIIGPGTAGPEHAQSQTDRLSDTGRRLADDAAPSAGPSAGQRTWLATTAIRVIVQRRLRGPLDLELVTRIAPMADPTALNDLRTALRSVAGLSASHGNHLQAIDSLSALLAITDESRDRATALRRRGDVQRDRGDWTAAMADYRKAVDLLADEDPSATAELALGMARLTWDTQTGAEVDALLVQTLSQLVGSDDLSASRITLCLAGGSYQDGVSGTLRVSEDEIERARTTVADAFDPSVRAWGLIHARKALLGVVDAERSAAWAAEIVELAGSDIGLEAHGRQASFVDSVRLGRWEDAQASLDRIGDLAKTADSVEQRFSALVAATCWDFANGRIEQATAGVAAEEPFRDSLQGSTFDQVNLAHHIWVARLSQNQEMLAGLAAAAEGLTTEGPGGAIWVAGAALVINDAGDSVKAADLLNEYLSAIGGTDGLAPGPHRLPFLAIAALVASSTTPNPIIRPTEVEAILGALDDVDATMVLIGWPTVILGSVARFRAHALAALGRPEAASAAMAEAMATEEPMPGLRAEAERAWQDLSKRI